MNVFLVGGAVRDQLLNITNHDRDWVVIGATPQDMLDKGFVAVGKDFPVFLHPTTKEEYALARTERKSGPGYTGFDCFFSPNVTLEQDLMRRDLTINAIAQSEDGQLIDPFHGQQDIEQRRLRHVSEAFKDDPLRVLRVARFAAKLHHLNFVIAPETLQLMQTMSRSGELNYLTAERVWQEWNKALTTRHPHIFLQVLHDCGALLVVMPEMEQLFNRLDNRSPLTVAKRIATQSTSASLRFAATVYPLAELTPKNPTTAIIDLCRKLKIPNDYKTMALLMARHAATIHQAMTLTATQLLSLLDSIDVWRKPEQLTPLLLCCENDFSVRSQSDHYPQAQRLIQAYEAALTIQVRDIIQDGLEGAAIRDELNRRRITAITEQLSRSAE